MHKHVILAGAGCSNPEAVLEIGVPVLSSWQAGDKFDNTHPNYFGRPGVYGQRAANRILYEADKVMVIGNRQAIWNVGYEGIPSHKITDHVTPSIGWMDLCAKWRTQYPLVESPAHDDTTAYINSYRFVERLQKHFLPDQIIVTDMGAAHICANQVLRLKPPQRLISSGGLGEMGCGLPMAIGAAFASKRPVLCMAGDGGMMMNLQELQTIVHHQLPICIIVFNNGGYGMIRHTQNTARMPLVGVNAPTGVSFPDFRRLALAFGFTASEIRTWDDFERIIPSALNRGPTLIEYFMDPEQLFVPKLDPVFVDGKPTSPRFCDLSPLI